jgi:hypothetical protein
LYKTNLYNANLSYTNLSYINLSFSNLEKTNLSNAILSNANLKNVDLFGPYLKNIIINNIQYDTKNLIKLMLDNKEKILTVDFWSKEGLSDYGIEEFIEDYELGEEKLLYNDSMFLGDLAEHNKIEDMLDDRFFIYIILKICKVI